MPQFRFSGYSGGEPLPVVQPTLADDEARITPLLTAILDTGADGTLAPFHLLQAAGFKPGRVRRDLTPSGVDRPVEIVVGFEVTVKIGSLELPDMVVYGSREVKEAVLGRDVLNQLVFTYDGPRRVLDLLSL